MYTILWYIPANLDTSFDKLAGSARRREEPSAPAYVGNLNPQVSMDHSHAAVDPTSDVAVVQFRGGFRLSFLLFRFRINLRKLKIEVFKSR
ncbi:hypothetical protein ACET3Z_018475 [Daucus carota]